MYFTKDSLRTYTASRRYEESARKNLARTARAPGIRTIFLSHSHADLEDIQNAKILLAAAIYVDIYIDALDPKMPPVTSAATAELLRLRIQQCDKFVVVATNRAVESKWVPWELGYADGKKRPGALAILPLARDSETWPKTEYFGLYPRIEFINGQAAVVAPGQPAPQPLLTWLLSG